MPYAKGEEANRKFVALLSSSPNLKRLHIEPTGYQLDSTEKYQTLQSFVRVGTEIMVDMWSLLKPFACLPAHVTVTTQGDWGGYCEDTWYHEDLENDTHNYRDEYTSLFEKGFVAMHTAWAGRPIPNPGEKWAIPGLVNEEGDAFEV